MLFDLRSRGRRRTVQGVYLGLAILMGGGLVLFGVGAGNGLGGLLNAFGGGGSSSGQTQAVDQQTKAAVRQTQEQPSNPEAWANLLQARWTAAGQGSNYNASTGTFTAAGQQQLRGAVEAWQRYLQLEKTPEPNLAILAAEAYGGLKDWSGEASAWDQETISDPSAAKGYECMAVSAYAASQARLGGLAAAKALSLVPKSQRATLETTLKEAKSSATSAQQLAAQC